MFMEVMLLAKYTPTNRKKRAANQALTTNGNIRRDSGFETRTEHQFPLTGQPSTATDRRTVTRSLPRLKSKTTTVEDNFTSVIKT
jgi:hypothetical protein